MSSEKFRTITGEDWRRSIAEGRARKNLLAEMIRKGLARRCEKSDAYYEVKTGKYLEPVCGDPECHFCASRPNIPVSNAGAKTKG